MEKEILNKMQNLSDKIGNTFNSPQFKEMQDYFLTTHKNGLEALKEVISEIEGHLNLKEQFNKYYEVAEILKEIFELHSVALESKSEVETECNIAESKLEKIEQIYQSILKENNQLKEYASKLEGELKRITSDKREKKQQKQIDRQNKELQDLRRENKELRKTNTKLEEIKEEEGKELKTRNEELSSELREREGENSTLEKEIELLNVRVTRISFLEVSNSRSSTNYNNLKELSNKCLAENRTLKDALEQLKQEEEEVMLQTQEEIKDILEQLEQREVENESLRSKISELSKLKSALQELERQNLELKEQNKELLQCTLEEIPYQTKIVLKLLREESLQVKLSKKNLENKVNEFLSELQDQAKRMMIGQNQMDVLQRSSSDVFDKSNGSNDSAFLEGDTDDEVEILVEPINTTLLSR